MLLLVMLEFGSRCLLESVAEWLGNPQWFHCFPISTCFPLCTSDKKTLEFLQLEAIVHEVVFRMKFSRANLKGDSPLMKLSE